MKMTKRILSSALAFLMTVGAGGGALAETSTTGESPVRLTAEATTFNVTVPTDIPLQISSEGKVTTPAADALKIVNNSAGPVRITDIEIRKLSDWNLVSPDNASFITPTIDEKKLSVQLTANQGVAGKEITVQTNDSGELAGYDNWTVDPWVINGGGEIMSLSTAANATPVAGAENDTAASIVFVIDWYGAGTTASPVSVQLDETLVSGGTTAAVARDGSATTVTFESTGGLLPSEAAFKLMNPDLTYASYTFSSDHKSATLTLTDVTAATKINLTGGYDLTVTYEWDYYNGTDVCPWECLRIGDNDFVDGDVALDYYWSGTLHNVVAVRAKTGKYIAVVDSDNITHPLERETQPGYYMLTGASSINQVRWASCIDYNSLVTMADGSLKKLGDIEVGDMVLSVDWNTKTLVARKVIYSGRDEEDYGDWYVNAYWENVYSDGTVINQAMRHRFYHLETEAFDHLDTWQTGWHAYKLDGTNPYLVSRTLVQGRIYYARITLEGDNNYFANGLLTGDSESQAGLALTEALTWNVKG